MLNQIFAIIGFMFIFAWALSSLGLFNTIYYVGITDKVLITKAEYEHLLANQKDNGESPE